MDALIETLNDWSFLLSSHFGTFLWQSTLLVLLVALFTRLFKQTSPAVRFWLWQIVAVKLLLLPFWIVSAPLPDWFAAEQTMQTAVDDTNSEMPVLTSPKNPTPAVSGDTPLAISPIPPATSPRSKQQIAWQTWLLATWLAVVLYQIARVVGQRRGLLRLLSNAQTDLKLAAIVKQCADTLGLRKVPQTLLIEADVSPFVCGLRRPRLVLSQSLLATTSSARLRQVVLHELAHIRRRDLLWCWVPTVMQIVYWFHPAAHWVAYRVQLERELACDQLAMEHSGSSAHDYADTLIDVVSQTASRVAAQAALSAQLVGGPKP